LLIKVYVANSSMEQLVNGHKTTRKTSNHTRNTYIIQPSHLYIQWMLLLLLLLWWHNTWHFKFKSCVYLEYIIRITW